MPHADFSKPLEGFSKGLPRGPSATHGGPQRYRRQDYANLRLAMECIDRHEAPEVARPQASVDDAEDAPNDPVELGRSVRALAHRMDTDCARFVELLVRFDESGGWRDCGAKNCMAWAQAEIGVGYELAKDQLRVGKRLRALPVIAALFRNGRLTWTKVRHLTRVANTGNENALAFLAIDETAAGVERLCRDYRWGGSDRSPGDGASAEPSANGLDDGSEPAPDDASGGASGGVSDSASSDASSGASGSAPDNAPDNDSRSVDTRSGFDRDVAEDRTARARRSLACVPKAHGCAGIYITGPVEEVALVRTAIERVADAIFDASKASEGSGALPTVTATQRRFDALVQLAVDSLAAEPNRSSSSDCGRVVLDIDAEVLGADDPEFEDWIAGLRARAATAAARAAGAPIGEPLDKAVDGLDGGTPPDDARTSAPPAATRHRSIDPSSARAPVPLDLPLRCAIQGMGRISAATAQRIACDGSIVPIISERGMPLHIGRASRAIPDAIRRAVLRRDGHCQFPGCEQTHHLDCHHLLDWARGGETSLEGLLAVCRFHHTLVHEERWIIERIEYSEFDAVAREVLEAGGAAAVAQARRLGGLAPRFRFRRAGAARASGRRSESKAGESENPSADTRVPDAWNDAVPGKPPSRARSASGGAYTRAAACRCSSSTAP